MFKYLILLATMFAFTASAQFKNATNGASLSTVGSASGNTYAIVDSGAGPKNVQLKNLWVGGSSNATTAGNITAGAVLNVANAEALTNIYVPSVIKIISQTRPVNGDTNWFGPWTPGTTTAGFQEAWDSAYKGTNYGPILGGVEIKVQAGVYFPTGQMDFRTVYPFSTTIRGQNLLSTRIAFAGTNNGVSWLTFGSLLGAATNGGLNLPAHVTLSDFSLSAVHDMNTNILLEVKDYSDLNLNRINFTGWQALTNQVDGAGVSLDASSYAGVTGSGLVGIKAWRGPEHGTHLSSLYFMQLAVGGDFQNDHVFAEDLRFAHIGKTTNPWPVASQYSLGADILRAGGLNDLWIYGHCYSSKGGFFLTGEAYNSPVLYGWNFESCDTPMASLRANARTPLAINPTVYGDAAWVSGPANQVYCLSNSPSWGILTGVIHTNGVVWGTDGYSVASGSAFEVWFGGQQNFLVDRSGIKTVGRIDVNGPSSQTSTVDGTTGFTATDGVNYSEMKADGAAAFASGLSGSTTAGFLFTEKLIINAAGVPQWSIESSSGGLNMNDEVNAVPGALRYDFTTGVLGFGEMSATKVTTPKVEMETSGPTITSGSSAPASSEPDGSLYLRTTGIAYVRTNSTWKAFQTVP